MSSSTSTARMKKLRVAHYIAVEGSSGRSNRAQSEAPAKSQRPKMRGTRSAAYVFIADEDYSAVVSLVLSVNRP